MLHLTVKKTKFKESVLNILLAVFKDSCVGQMGIWQIKKCSEELYQVDDFYRQKTAESKTLFWTKQLLQSHVPLGDGRGPSGRHRTGAGEATPEGLVEDFISGRATTTVRSQFEDVGLAQVTLFCAYCLVLNTIKFLNI